MSQVKKQLWLFDTMLDFSDKKPIIFNYQKCYIKNKSGEKEEIWRPIAHVKIGKRKLGMCRVQQSLS